MKHSLLLAFCLAFSFPAFPQTNIVEPNPIEASVHKNNIGKITFMSSSIPMEEYKEADFLKNFEMSNKSNLYIRTFLANSLTNYLHPLAPSLGADELNKVGNFQFTFYVDGNPVYKENLNQGAFGLENKNKATVFRVPLMTVNNEDSWGRFLWNRFMMKGGEDALGSGSHVLKIEIRPYMANPEEKTGDVIAVGDIVVSREIKKIAEQKLLPSPIRKGSGWETVSPSYDIGRIKELKNDILTDKLKKITSIIVIRNGKLLLEEYFNGANRNTLHDTRSVSKTFTSALTGIAIAEGYIKDINQALGEFYDLKRYEHYSPQKDQVTLKNFLTMSSAFDGFDFDDKSPGNEENMYPQKDWVTWTLNLPMADRKPGEQWAYFTAGVVVLGDILNKHVPGGLEKYADAKLFKPLGITKYTWEYTPQKVANTAGGLKLSSIDLARFGQMYLNEGQWNGKQILPERWAKESLTRQITIPIDEMNYGYLFWNKSFKVSDTLYESYFCSGNGGNKVHIFEKLNTVVVITSQAYNTPYMHQQADRIIEKYILPAIVK